MGDVLAKCLGDGQLPSSTGDLVTVPSSHTYVVTGMLLVNTSGSDVTVNIFMLKPSSADRLVSPKAFTVPANGFVSFDHKVMLEAGFKLRGNCSAATTVDFVINGYDQDLTEQTFTV